MSTLLRVSASLALLSALVSTAGAQLDPVFPGLTIPVAPTDSAASFDSGLVAADIDLDGRSDLLSVVLSGDGPATVQVLSVARALPDGGYATPETWTVMPIQPSHVGAADVGDLDGNGWPDVAVAGAHQVSVLRGYGGGNFGPSASYFVSAEWLWDIELVDVNRDGRLDLVTASYGYPPVGGAINVNLADGSGGFLATQVWPLASPPEAIACGDLDGDGWLDVAAVGPDAAVLQILPSDGAGGFLAPQSLAADVAPQRVLLASLDADADLDVVVVAKGEGQTPTSGRVRAWLNDGAGQLQAGEAVSIGKTDTDGLLHDVDADGDLDVVVVDNGKNEQLEQVLLIDNDGAGGLSLGLALRVGEPIQFAVMADATADGVADLLLTPIDISAALLPARPDGSLATGSVCNLPHTPQHCATADLDGDGWLDVFYAATNPSIEATLLGSADGLLPTPIPSPAFGTSAISCLSLGDLTGDSLLDALFVYGINPGRAAVAPGLGDGTFGNPLLVAPSPFTPSSPQRIEPVDLNDDGWLDAVELGYVLPCRLDVYLNQGASKPGQLLPGKNFPPGAHTHDFAVADLDGDAMIDAAVARGPTAEGLPCTLATMFGDGKGGFAQPVAIDLPATGIETEFVALADVDLDGQLDAVVALHHGSLVLAKGDGSGGWSPGGLLPPVNVNSSGGMAVVDVDGDGWPDVVQGGGSSTDKLAVRRGDGAGGLLAPDLHCASGSVSDILLADMNRDGRPDAVQIDSYTQDAVHGHVQVIENTRGTFTWTDLGHAKAGPHGLPHLTGTGTLAPGSNGALHLGQAAPSALAALIVSDAEQPLAWKGGVLVPAAPQLLVYVATDVQGRVLLTWSAFAGGPAGATLVFQYAISDAGAPQGLALSNALRGTLPE